MSSSRRKPSSSRRRPAPEAPKRVSMIPWVAGGVIAVGLITVILLTVGSGSDALPEFGAPTVTGAPLPRYQATVADPAVDGPIPSVAGADWEGNPVSITDDGRAKAIIFFAHWCPVCGREVPALTEWLAANEFPPEVDVYTVATGIDPEGDNYPTSSWLERENWTLPVIMDDESHTVAENFGLSAYPFWVFVSDEGTVIGRLDGYLEPETLGTVLETVAEV